MSTSQQVSELLVEHERTLRAAWQEALAASSSVRSGRLKEAELAAEANEFLAAFLHAWKRGGDDVGSAGWDEVRAILGRISRSRARLGLSPSDTAMFVFALKRPAFELVRDHFQGDPAAVGEGLWTITRVLDALGLHTTEVYQKGREEVIQRQQEEMLELSTPVVKLWDGILALPMIGTLDSNRTQVVMESLLQKIVETESEIAIVDITGVPTVDTLVAQHLLKTVTAARLMGAECILSGIRPQIAATIVHLGIDLGHVTTKATLASAFQFALRRLGRSVTAAPAAVPSPASFGRG